MCLSIRADNTGECWASEKTLADDTGFGVSAVSRALDALVAAGALVRHTRTGHTTLYTFGTFLPRSQVPPPSVPRTDRYDVPIPPVPRTDPPRSLVPIPSVPRTDDQPTDQPIGSAQGSDTQRRARPTSLDETLILAECSALQQGARSDILGLSRDDMREIRIVVRDLGWRLPELALIWAYIQQAAENHWWRTHGKNRWSSLLGPKAEGRLGDARAWDARGRTSARSPPDSRPSPAPNYLAALDRLIQDEQCQ